MPIANLLCVKDMMKRKVRDLDKSVSIAGAAIITVILIGFLVLMFYVTINQVSYLSSLDAEKRLGIKAWASYGPYLWITASLCIPNTIGIWIFALNSEKEIKSEIWDNLIIPTGAVFIPFVFFVILKFIVPTANDLSIEDLTGKDFIYLVSLVFSGFWIAILRILRKVLVVRLNIF